MNWRLKAADYNLQKGEGNKRAMKKLLSRSSPGIIAYSKDKAVGWCAIAPREEYIRLETSRVLKPVDAMKVWSVSCFFIAKEYRRGLGYMDNISCPSVSPDVQQCTIVSGGSGRRRY